MNFIDTIGNTLGHTIHNIISPFSGPNPSGQITFIPKVVFKFVTGSNIALETTTIVNRALIMTYAFDMWYPSY